ncbi:MAG: hypothetical protein SCH66_06890 [Methanolobus sp.]|nr:hypothetical protein [Methanolobus sp.]
MEDDTVKISKQEVHELLNKGNELLDILEQNSVWNSLDYTKNRSRFVSGYTKWYKQSLCVIRNLGPDRYDKFKSIFSTNKRSGVNEYTYTIQDYIHGIYLDNRPKNHTDDVTSRKLKEQIEILRSAYSRINEFTFDLESYVKINPIYSNQTSFTTTGTNQIIQIDMEEEHYNSLKTEINSTFRLGLFISTFLLSKELIENLLIDILRLIFPPTSKENIHLYFDIKNHKFKELGLLLDIMTRKKGELPFDDTALDELTGILERMVPRDKPTSHSSINIPSRDDIAGYRIGETVEILVNTKQALKGKKPF